MLTRRERIERRQALRDYVRSEAQAGNISRRDATRIRAASRFNPDAVDRVLDDLMEEQEDDGHRVERLGNGERDWAGFFELVKELIPLFVGLC